MWSSISDMSRDECRKCLRCLELDAYGNMVSVLRAQGPYTEEKRKLLGELAKILHISNERHRAEIRRAVNDEKLSVIAEQLNGPNTYTDWAIEGRRTIPLLPRLKARTAFTGLANSLSLVIAAANEKKLAPPSRLQDPIVKSEPASPENLQKEEQPIRKSPVLPGEIKTRGRKRKRSAPESLDNEKCKKTESKQRNNMETESSSKCLIKNRTGSPLEMANDELSKVVQVSIVTPSSPIDPTSRTTTDNTLETLFTQVHSNHHKLITDSLDDRIFDETNSPATTLSLETDNNRQDILKDINGGERIIAQSEMAKILGFEDTQPGDDEFLKNATQPDKSTKISRPDSTTCGAPAPKRLITNKLCVPTKPIITSSTNCMVSVNSTSTASCRPGSPFAMPSKSFTCKKVAAEKLNHRSGTKSAIASDCRKTLKINAHSNARLSSKANVIVVQKKGSSRGVTLSHGGKEVLGKVIMSGKNLCLANQKNNTCVTLLPHRGDSSNNGQVTLTSLNVSNDAENIDSGAKPGSNMLMLDIRQETLEETSVGLKNATNSEDGTTTKNHNCLLEKSVLTKNPGSLVLNGLSRSDGTNLYSIVGTLDSPVTTDNPDILETIEDDKVEVEMEVEEILETPTELYDYESADGIIIEESIETSGVDIFGTTLESPMINLENLEYVNNEEQEIIIETTSDEILEEENSFCQEAEKIDRLGDS